MSDAGIEKFYSLKEWVEIVACLDFEFPPELVICKDGPIRSVVEAHASPADTVLEGLDIIDTQVLVSKDELANDKAGKWLSLVFELAKTLAYQNGLTSREAWRLAHRVARLYFKQLTEKEQRKIESEEPCIGGVPSELTVVIDNEDATKTVCVK